MIRIFLASFFTLAIVICLDVLAPIGNWLYLAGLMAGTAGMTALCFVSKEI